MESHRAPIRGLEPARLRRLVSRGVAQRGRRRRARARARRGVHGSLEVAYRACLESRVGSRVFLVVAQFNAPTDASFYEAAARHRLAQRTSIRRARWPATSRANIPRSRTRASARCVSRTRSAISCAMPPAAVPTSRPIVRRCACTRMPTARTSRCPSICRARVCIGADIARRPARRRCARTSRPASCCARAGRRNRRPPRSSSIPCAARARWSSKRR